MTEIVEAFQKEKKLEINICLPILKQRSWIVSLYFQGTIN